MSDERPLTTGEVARFLHVTPVAVLSWIRDGKLQAYRVPGGRHRIPRDVFRKFLADNKIPLTLDPPSARRILIVDDEESVREAFGAALAGRGYEIITASDGPEALAVLKAKHFDLIFLDILLPGLSGASLLGAVKRWDPEAVVVISTGFPQHEETLEALEYGPAMLLRKPVKISDIETVLRIVFED